MKLLKNTLLCGIAVGLLGTASPEAADWPQWRGPDRDGKSPETNLMESWPSSGLAPKWIYRDAGVGYSGPAVVGKAFYIMGGRGGDAYLIALNVDTGKEMWAVEMGDLLDNGWGDGPRGTPAVDGGRVYAMSGQGILVCADAINGSVHWKVSMRDLGGREPNWGYTESVLVDGDLVLCTPGGDEGTVAALNKTTGGKVWQSSRITDEAHYSSIVTAMIHGSKQYIQRTEESVFGLDPKNGNLLWRTDFPGRTAVIPTPIVKDNLVYVTAGYGAGCKLIRVEPDNSLEEVYSNNVMKNHHGGVVLLEGNVYGHSDGVGWVCQDFMTGEEVWSEKRALGKGAVTYADGKLYCLFEGDGTVALIDANPNEYKEISRFKLTPQSEIRKSRGRIWTHPVIANGMLYLRDQDLVYCFDIQDKG